MKGISSRNSRVKPLVIDKAAVLPISTRYYSRMGPTLCVRTLADSTGPKGEKICRRVEALVDPGIPPIQSARVGNALWSMFGSGDVTDTTGFATT